MKSIITIFFILFLSSCGRGFDAYQLGSAEQEFRQRCFGSDTVGCQDMDVDLQIMIAEFMLDTITDNEDLYVKACSASGYEEIVDKIELLIEAIDDARPNILLRTFSSDGMWSPSRVPHFTKSDYDDLVDATCLKHNGDMIKSALSGGGQ